MTNHQTVYRYLVAAASIVVVVAGMRAARPLLVPFLLAAFFAVILAPVLLWLKTKGLRTSVALLIILSAFTLLGIGLTLLVGESFNDFSEKLPAYQKSLTAQTKPLIDWLDSHGIELPRVTAADPASVESPVPSASASDLPSNLSTSPQDPASSTSIANSREDVAGENNGPAVKKPLDAAWLLGFVKSMLAGVGDIFSNALVIFITVTFMLLETSRMAAKLQTAFGKSDATIKHIDVIVGNVRRYVAIKTATSALTGILVTLSLVLLGIEYAILWGLLAFLFNFIPNVGSIMAAVPAIALALVQAGVPTALGAAGVYIAINCLISYAIEPRFMGQGLGLSALVVFLSLVFWGWVLGPIGMLLSPPLTMIVKIVLEDYEETRWIAILMSSSSTFDTTSDKTT